MEHERRKSAIPAMATEAEAAKEMEAVEANQALENAFYGENDGGVRDILDVGPSFRNQS
jgi:hypothetical protein